MHLEFATQSGKVVLEQYSDYERRRRALDRFRRVLAIDDQRFDGEVLKAMLHVCLGHDTEVNLASSIGAAMEAVRQTMPDLIFLDDYLGRTSTAPESFANLRRWGYVGPVIIVSAMLTIKRRRELSHLGASASIHKDDLTSMSITEILLGLDDPV